MALFDSCVAAWKLSDLADATGRGNTLNNINAVTFVAGKIGNAANLVQASHQYLTANSNDDVALGDRDWTLALWAKWNTFGNQTLASKYHTGTPGQELREEFDLFWNYSNDGKIRFSVWRASDTALITVASNSGLVQDTWYCIIVYHDSVNDLIGISIDNDTPNTTATGGPITAADTNAFLIGNYDPGGQGPPIGGNYFSGLIDDVNIFHKVFSSQDRTDFYNSGAGVEFPTATGEPWLYYYNQMTA